MSRISSIGVSSCFVMCVKNLSSFVITSPLIQFNFWPDQPVFMCDVLCSELLLSPPNCKRTQREDTTQKQSVRDYAAHEDLRDHGVFIPKLQHILRTPGNKIAHAVAALGPAILVLLSLCVLPGCCFFCPSCMYTYL